MYDAHTHINSEKMYPQREHYLEAFIQAGGKGLVNSGASDFYNEKGIEIAKAASKKYPNIYVKSTIGRHPLECVQNIITKETYHQKMQELKSQYHANKEHIVAIGEIGIDLHFPNGPETIDFQKELFALQCDFAQEVHLPIMIHSRDNFAQTRDVLKNYKDQTIYFHCRGYGPEEYKQLRDMIPDLYIGFCGNITYKKVDNLLETLKIIDTNQLVLETDAPYLTPQVVRGQTNEPAYVQYIYDFVAQYTGIPRQKLISIIESNIKTLYRMI